MALQQDVTRTCCQALAVTQEMEILSWNVQYGRGVDGTVNPKRTALAIRGIGDPDIICLQEVARFYPEVDGGEGTDQVALFADSFPRHEPVFGPAVNRSGGSGGRRQFGNLMLSRFPVLQVFLHLLPEPPAPPGVKHMPRQAIEVVVASPRGPLRIMTTHLEYYSSSQREAQVDRLRVLHAEVAGNLSPPPEPGVAGPFAWYPRPSSSVLCGDFNFRPEDGEYGRILAPLPGTEAGFQDAWPLVHGTRPHAATCGVFDREQWSEGAHCRDFFFVTEDLAGSVTALGVDSHTQASDHQPLLLGLED